MNSLPAWNFYIAFAFDSTGGKLATRTTFWEVHRAKGVGSFIYLSLNKRNALTRSGRISISRFFVDQCSVDPRMSKIDGDDARIYRRYLCFWNAIRAVLIKSRRGVDDSYREFFAIFAFLCSLEVNSARIAPFPGG